MGQKITREDKAGLYLTAILHLAVIIILLICQIGGQLQKETSFVLDFSKQERIEKEKAQEVFKEDISKKLDELLKAAPNYSAAQVRNIAVDRSAPLKDDRNTDADQLYKDAERLKRELADGQNAIQEDARSETVDMGAKPVNKEKSGPAYSGPSVVSYNLDGRKASHLNIPAYRCMGAGDVTVIITVNKAGQVINAKVMEGVSSDDGCLRNFAVRAARLSRFSASSTAPDKQMGEIVYRFIAQ